MTPNQATLLGSYELKITNSGFWSNLKEKPKVIVCLDDETKLAQSDVSVDIENLYSYSPKASLPTATINPTPHFNYPKTSLIYTFINYEHCKECRSKFDTITLKFVTMKKKKIMMMNTQKVIYICHIVMQTK